MNLHEPLPPESGLYKKYRLSFSGCNWSNENVKSVILGHNLVVWWLESHPEDQTRFFSREKGYMYFDCMAKAEEATGLKVPPWQEREDIPWRAGWDYEMPHPVLTHGLVYDFWWIWKSEIERR